MFKFWLMARVTFWILRTTWIGAATLVRFGRLLLRFPQSLRETLLCPRGHETPLYGVFECSCGAIHEGWAFGRCAVCGESAGWTPCPACGLAVKNPLWW